MEAFVRPGRAVSPWWLHELQQMEVRTTLRRSSVEEK
jgi:hypothetical protein